eukprot:SAG31_NODE_841_length_11595_cov_3.739388_9_plen_384_part_00
MLCYLRTAHAARAVHAGQSGQSDRARPAGGLHAGHGRCGRSGSDGQPAALARAQAGAGRGAVCGGTPAQRVFALLGGRADGLGRTRAAFHSGGGDRGLCLSAAAKRSGALPRTATWDTESPVLSDRSGAPCFGFGAAQGTAQTSAPLGAEWYATMRQRYALSATGGFLPDECLVRLPAAYEPWEALVDQLPELNKQGALEPRVEALPVLETAAGLTTPEELRRASWVLAALAHSYVNGRNVPWAALGGDDEPSAPRALPEGELRRLPAGLAVPWFEVCGRLGMPPVFTAATADLWNWREVVQPPRAEADHNALSGRLERLAIVRSGLSQFTSICVQDSDDWHLADLIDDRNCHRAGLSRPTHGDASSGGPSDLAHLCCSWPPF